MSGDLIERLPDALAIFPLTGALLLPRGNLPLQIFEPRYLNMVEDALGSGRVIGMVQPRKPEPDPIGDTVDIYGTGCLGRIVSFAETDDGRFLISLKGVCRFKVVEELAPVNGYRRIRPDFEPFRADLQQPPDEVVDRLRLIEAVRHYLTAKQLNADWSAIESASSETLVTSLAILCPFEPREKQALLESADPGARGEMLISLLEMAVHDADGSDNGARH